MASFPELMLTTPRLANGFETTTNDTDVDDPTAWASSYSSSYDYDNSLDLLTNVPVFAVYAITFLVGMTGNLLVIFAVVKSRRLHNVTCFFLANLAVADLLTVVFLIPLQIIVHSSDHWNLGDVMCRLVAYVGVISPALTNDERHQRSHTPSPITHTPAPITHTLTNNAHPHRQRSPSSITHTLTNNAQPHPSRTPSPITHTLTDNAHPHP
ncbi:C-C chemokine receptor type 1-like [Strongylocentrotus purpuratus]|uniref:G-protein coupled receptors family 1 profile domain-containing protein n=1 Tax=Strongylocentrotus purpuratus TaxID=7668 RepID=A0A7M7PH61_STRPU|nr:C-C chemokine receptor type 1-like [Strongylocentrotus purpuratus]